MESYHQDSVQRSMTKIRELPGDLVEEILCRVPVTCVKRVRTTCKRWDGLFNDKRFMRKHSDKAAKQFMYLMLTKRSKVCPMSVNLDGIIPSVEVKDELSSLIDPRSSNSALQFLVDEVFHCDGLFLCTSVLHGIVVWNPFTGQTKWIEDGEGEDFSLGYYQDNRSYSRRYKVLSFYNFDYDFSLDSNIYDFDSDSWRVLDGDSARRRACRCNDQTVSFKGNTYWFVSDKEKPELGVYLLRFDFSTEKYGHVSLPYQSRYYTSCLSVVREEKLSVLLQREVTSKTEIWVTDKIGESETNNKRVSWSKVLALDLSLDLQISDLGSFLLDEEKKVVMFCDRWIDDTYTKDMVYIVGEDNIVTQKDFGVDDFDGCWPAIHNYSPSLAQIQGARGKKRKRLDM